MVELDRIYLNHNFFLPLEITENASTLLNTHSLTMLPYLVISGEAIRLAKDYAYICETEFPAKQCADYNSRSVADPTDLHTRKNMVLAAK